MKQDRREFLMKSCAALSMGAMATQMRHFGLMSAAAQSAISDDITAAPSDYRALVCIFLQGGNDGNNMIVPNHSDATVSNYADYTKVRGTPGLALAQGTLLPIAVPRMAGLTYGLHPSFGPQTVNGTTIVNRGIHDLWDLGKMAAVTNVGTLAAPTTRVTYLNNSVPKPYQLFSHSDQVTQYQGGRSDAQPFTGWGGRVADLLNVSTNGQAALVPMITSIAGAQLFTSGLTTLPIAIADSNTSLANVLKPAGYGTGTMTGSTLARFNAFNALRTQDLLSNDVLAAASYVTDQAIKANNALQTPVTLGTVFPNTGLGRQLKQVALLIKKRTDLAVTRQIFYAQIGGFDTHTDQPLTQANQLLQVSQAMRAFYEEMTLQGIGDKVTQFTMADFSRTFSPAGTGAGVGTDHGWGNHMMVVGGGIMASNFYGMNGFNGTPFPQLAFNAADDSDNGSGARGRWVPATSIEQYAATLARWFGVPSANMLDVFPKINKFPAGVNTDLGFMQPPAA